MPIPQLPSLLLTKGVPTLNRTLRDWIELVGSVEEFHALCDTVRGVPHGWVDWVERTARESQARGGTISQPLPFRLSLLLNGIVNLQECKYVVDTIENALRGALVDYSASSRIEIADILSTVPDNDKLKPTPSCIPELVVKITFYQLVATLDRNWEKIRVSPRHVAVAGFRTIFRDNKKCRDKNRFWRDMELARKYRNDISHTRRLFTFSEVDHLYRRLSDWFVALRIDLSQRINSYRKLRPKFLEGLA